MHTADHRHLGPSRSWEKHLGRHLAATLVPGAHVDALHAWAAKLDELGEVHGPVEDVQYAVAVTARTPADIPVEFFVAK